MKGHTDGHAVRYPDGFDGRLDQRVGAPRPCAGDERVSIAEVLGLDGRDRLVGLPPPCSIRTWTRGSMAIWNTAPCRANQVSVHPPQSQTRVGALAVTTVARVATRSCYLRRRLDRQGKTPRIGSEMPSCQRQDERR